MSAVGIDYFRFPLRAFDAYRRCRQFYSVAVIPVWSRETLFCLDLRLDTGCPVWILDAVSSQSQTGHWLSCLNARHANHCHTLACPNGQSLDQIKARIGQRTHCSPQAACPVPSPPHHLLLHRTHPARIAHLCICQAPLIHKGAEPIRDHPHCLLALSLRPRLDVSRCVQAAYAPQVKGPCHRWRRRQLSLIHISEPTRPY